MMKWSCLKYIFLLISSLCLVAQFTCGLFAQAVDIRARNILHKVDSVNSTANGLKFKVKMYARMKGDNYQQVALFKIQRDPLKIYYRQYKRNQIELLYDETKNAEKALVNPAGFPYTNLWLSPYSPLILRRQHHTIFEADPSYTLNQLSRMFNKCQPSQCKVEIKDTIIQQKRFKFISYNNQSYKIKTQTITHTTQLLDFAETHHLNFYSIILQNKHLNINSSLEKGDTINIPSAYAKKIHLIINTRTYFIKSISVFDQLGLFEKYHYLWFRNVENFSYDTFHKDNDSYNF